LRPRLLALVVGVQALVVAAVVAATAGWLSLGGGGDDGAARAAALAPRPAVDRFDAARAFALLRHQVQEIGPRPAGSPAARRLARWARARLPRGRLEPVPGHPALQNVVGTLPGDRPAVLVAAHYDTADTPRGMPGANDGAAGTAVVLELARALRPRRGAREVRFVLFDGEEAPGDRDFLRRGLRGSKAYARAHAGEIGQMILLDYVGDRELSLPREGSSDPALWAALRRAARRVGVQRVFPARRGIVISDDHTPFLRAGVPAIDLIDWPYRHMHTLRDTVDKTSPRSLDAVGEAVLELVGDLRRR
jgi:hypothetical protein